MEEAEDFGDDEPEGDVPVDAHFWVRMSDAVEGFDLLVDEASENVSLDGGVHSGSAAGNSSGSPPIVGRTFNDFYAQSEANRYLKSETVMEVSGSVIMSEFYEDSCKCIR